MKSLGGFMVKNIHKKLLLSKTPFGYAAVTALIIGIGDLIATGTDIFWLLGDMAIQTHSHYVPVLVGLTIAESIMAFSFIYLYLSINKYLISKMNRKINRKAKRVTKSTDDLNNELNIDGE